jgi:hypothetical protein
MFGNGIDPPSVSVILVSTDLCPVRGFPRDEIDNWSKSRKASAEDSTGNKY